MKVNSFETKITVRMYVCDTLKQFVCAPTVDVALDCSVAKALAPIIPSRDP